MDHTEIKTASPIHGRPMLVRRLLAGLIAVVTGGILLTAWLLTPDASGNGTHTQLGLPTCNWIVLMDMRSASLSEAFAGV